MGNELKGTRAARSSKTVAMRATGATTKRAVVERGLRMLIDVREAERQRLGLLDLTVCEVLQGVSADAAAARVLRTLRRFEVFETGDIALAEAAARNYHTLRAHGRTVRKTIVRLIATFCLEHSHALLHSDRDFDPFEDVLGLQVVHPEGSE
ncbi:MAG: type II toxin-antitoxin system VapB family antitoxin [Vicinamibacterales bacterium]